MTLMTASHNTSIKLKREEAKNRSLKYDSLKFFDTAI